MFVNQLACPIVKTHIPPLEYVWKLHMEITYGNTQGTENVLVVDFKTFSQLVRSVLHSN